MEGLLNLHSTRYERQRQHDSEENKRTKLSYENLLLALLFFCDSHYRPGFYRQGGAELRM